MDTKLHDFLVKSWQTHRVEITGCCSNELGRKNCYDSAISGSAAQVAPSTSTTPDTCYALLYALLCFETSFALEASEKLLCFALQSFSRLPRWLLFLLFPAPNPTNRTTIAGNGRPPTDRPGWSALHRALPAHSLSCQWA